MPREMRRIAMGVLILTCVIVGGFLAISESGVFNVQVWERTNPLQNPFAVTSIQNGAITLADGRAFQPAGVRRAPNIPAEQFDEALRTIVAQGVVVIRDLGDGRAFLVAEPKFSNWCGTRGYHGNPWARWAGSYLQCPVSELLVQAAYAQLDLEAPGLTPRERWRLEGVEHLGPIEESPTRIVPELNALRYGGIESDFADYDELLELMWKPPPAQ